MAQAGGPIPHTTESPGAHPAEPDAHRSPHSRTDTYGARSTRRQGSVGEVWAAQVWNHQEGVPRVRRSLKESAILGPSHYGQNQSGVRSGVPQSSDLEVGAGIRNPSAPRVSPRVAAAAMGGEQGLSHPDHGDPYGQSLMAGEWRVTEKALTFGEVVARLLESVPGGLRAPLRLWRRHKGEGG